MVQMTNYKPFLDKFFYDMKKVYIQDIYHETNENLTETVITINFVEYNFLVAATYGIPPDTGVAVLDNINRLVL